MKQDKGATLGYAIKTLMLTDTFYGLFLIGMNKVWRKDLDTAGVSKHGINVQLAINEIFWENLSHQHRVGVLKHELLHIAFQHLVLRDKYKNKRLFNIAADLEINQYIDRLYLPGGTYPSKEAYEKDIDILVQAIQQKVKAGDISEEQAKKEMLALPIRCIFLEDFKELKLEPKKGTDYYYRELEKTMDQQGRSSHPVLDSLLDSQLGPGDGRGVPWKHMTWEEFEGLSEADKKLIQKQVDFQLKETAQQVQKSRGIIPAEMAGYIDSLFNEEPPKFDWRGYLRMFAGGSIKTYTKKTRRKPSKRFAGNPGLRIKHKKHILVGVDTSGSVSNDELKEFFAEIAHMHKTGADITVVQCDAAISSVRKYTKPKDGKIEITGRGGTSFQPVIDYFNEHKRDFSCLIYLTDGEAPAPEPKPQGRTLWVLSTRSRETDHLPGATIKLN